MARGNVDNLTQRSSDEARKNGQKGGIKSGESRRNKRLLQNALQTLLEGEYTIGKSKEKLGGYDAVATSMIKRAIKGDVKAATFIRDTIGEKPTDTIAFPEESNISGIKVKFVNKSNKKTGKEKDPKIVGEYTEPTNVIDDE